MAVREAIRAPTIECTRRIQFCTGHRIWGHENKCAYLHGHNYVAFFHATAPELDKIGRVIDFSVLKDRLGSWIDVHWDHGFLLHKDDQEAIEAVSRIPEQKLFLMDANPTAENMARFLLENAIESPVEVPGETPEGRRSAIVLLSGGLDSTTTLAIAARQGFEIHAMTFRYGQRHQAEIEAARRIAKRFGVAEHIVVEFDLGVFGGSALTSELEVPKGRSTDEMGSGIPITYVPARNTIFLSFALAWAEVLKCQDIFIGVNALDYSGYPDCRPEYIEAFEEISKSDARFRGRPTSLYV